MGLNALIGHHLCAALATHTLLVEKNPGKQRFSRRSRYAVAVVVMSVLFWYELPNTRSSLYATVGLPPTATQYDVVTYHAKLKAHIQQNGAPENIDAIKNAFQVLIHEERRNIYDRFGDIQSHVVGEAHLPVIATALAIAYHALSSIICFALYRSSQLALTRYLMFMYSAISFALEMECRFVGSSSVFKGVFYLNQLLPYQQVQLLRGLAPAIALLLNMICAYFFVDLERLSYFLWHSSVSTNRVILEKMADVVDATNYVKSMSSPSTAKMKVSAGSTEMPHVQSKKDGQQDAGTLNAQSSSSQQLLNLIESLDETQRQKMMDVLKRSTDADTKEDEEQGGWFNTVKSTAIYLAIFFLIKYYWK